MINSNFNRFNSKDFLAQVELIVTAMTGNANFPEPWSPQVPTLAQIQTDLAAYQVALTATQAGDRTQIPTRNVARSKLATDLFVLANYVQSMAPDAEDKLASSGFPLRQPAVRSKVVDLPAAPANFDLERGPVSGMLMVRASPVPTAASYDVQLCTGDPTVEANWLAAGSFKNCGRIELPGLTPGKTYSVRMRALNVSGLGAWTLPASLMVV